MCHKNHTNRSCLSTDKGGIPWPRSSCFGVSHAHVLHKSAYLAFLVSAKLISTARATAFSSKARTAASPCATACICQAAGGISRLGCVAAVACRVPSSRMPSTARSSSLSSSLSPAGRKSCGAASQIFSRSRRATDSAAFSAAPHHPSRWRCV